MYPDLDDLWQSLVTRTPLPEKRRGSKVFPERKEPLAFCNLSVVRWTFPWETRMSASRVRRAKAALSQWVKVPPGNRSSRKQPEQTMEVTKWLKPLVKRVTNW